MVTRVQTVIFKKDKWSKQSAIAYLKRKGLRHSVDEKEKTYRFRQFKPNDKKRHYTIKEKGVGISYVLEH